MSDKAIGVIELVGAALSIVDKAMDLIPNYDQRKKQKFYKMRMQYEDEKNKEYPHRDDNLVGIYRDRCLQFIAIFADEISGEKV